MTISQYVIRKQRVNCWDLASPPACERVLKDIRLCQAWLRWTIKDNSTAISTVVSLSICTHSKQKLMRIAQQNTQPICFVKRPRSIVRSHKQKVRMCHISVVSTRYRVPPCNNQACSTNSETVIQCEFRKTKGPFAICSNAKKDYMGVRYVKGRCSMHRDAGPKAS